MSTSSSAIALPCDEIQSTESTGAVATSEIAVSVRNLGKSYRLWNNPQDRLKQPLRSIFTRWLPIPHKQYFNEFWALRDINFDVKKGETLGIIGRNGSGKSTLLQILCGTLAPTCGSYETRGRIAALLELGSGFNPEFSGRDNVYMNASILGLTKEEIDERYESIVEFADIGQFIDQPVKTYSSGMYVRLAFAVAISFDPDILVVDEALAVGDAFFVQKGMRWMRKFKESGTLLFVSHDTGAVVNLCNHAIMLDKGSIKAVGSPKDISEFYLENLYNTTQETNATREVVQSNFCREEKSPCDLDDRIKKINASQHANDIQIFNFDPAAHSFGAGGALVINVFLEDPLTSKKIAHVLGGQKVTLTIHVKTLLEIVNPIIGFTVKDRLGQPVFVDNTFMTYSGSNLTVQENEIIEGSFTFRMPILPCGMYSISPAVAEGTQEHHVQHHWLHDALMFQVESSHVCYGLIGLPMEQIRMKIVEQES